MALTQSNSVADNLLSRLPVSPDAYPQALDLVREMVLLVRFDAAAYRAASFLDDRILNPSTEGAWIPVARVAEASRLTTDPRRLHFIFHTGHVGSTLVSRLLDETGDVLPLREPLPLRTLADAMAGLGQHDSLLSEPQFEFILAMFLRLWCRGYEQTRSVVVKATSSAGQMAMPILAASGASRAIYMNLRAEPYLATLLAGQNSPVDLRGHGPGRIRRLRLRLLAPLAPLHAMSIGELAAMSWITESLAQRDALNGAAGRVIALDFERFLADVPAGMARILRHFDLPGGDGYITALARSPALTRYSKAPEYAYSPDVRAEVLHNSRRDNRNEIRKGMDWLERLARSDTAVAEVVAGTAI